MHVHVILVFPLGFEHPGAPLTLVAFSHYTGSPTLTLASSSFFARPKSLFLFSSISQVSSSKEHAELFSEMGAQHFKDLLQMVQMHQSIVLSLIGNRRIVYATRSRSLLQLYESL